MSPPRPRGGSSNRKKAPSEPSAIPSSGNFCHSQYPQHLQFSQPQYAMNMPYQQFQQQPFPQQPLYPPNVQYVVVNPHYAPYSVPRPPPPPPALAMPSTSLSYTGTPLTEIDQGQDVTNADTYTEKDENAEPERARRLAYTEKEDIRLISAWLYNSGNKKNDIYWASVEAEYNSTTPIDRRREARQLKCHWHIIIKKIAHFDDCWCQVKAKYPCSLSDNMHLMDETWTKFNEEARALYLEEAKHHFSLGHCWKVVWDQPKWKTYISFLSSRKTKLSESRDYMSSSEDTEDVPEKEMGEQASITSKEKQEGKGKTPSSSSEVEKDIQASDLQNMHAINGEEMAGVQRRQSGQQLELGRLEQPETKDKEATSDVQTELMMTDASWLNELEPRSELLGETSKLEEFQYGGPVSEDVPGKETGPQVCETLHHDRTMKENIPKRKIRLEDCKTTKLKRKRKGKALPSSSEVQEDIKRAVELQAMLTKDREKMSEVQLRLSKEKLEFARIRQQEAKDRKETTLYEKYSELLMADTTRFNDFQKAEHERAVRCMGEMLFGRDENGS